MSRFSSLIAAAACFAQLFCAPGRLLAADEVELEVTGVGGDALRNVRDALVLPYGLVRDGKVDRLWLERFGKQAEEKARLALQPFGYYNAQVTAAVQERDPGEYRLLVAVTPGPPVVVTEVEVEVKGAGAGHRELRRLQGAFPLKKGDLLLQPVYEQAKGGLKSQAVNRGYLDADFSRHEIRIAPGATTARIALTLETGERYHFGGVRIEGAPEYPEAYLERFVAFQNGEIFSFEKIAETQLNFSNAERFKQVVVTPQKEQAEGRRVPVLVKLTPAPRRTLRTGVGYGTETGPRFSERYRDLNLHQKGHDLDLSLYVAQRLQGFAGRYLWPSTQDMKSSTTLQLNLQREDITTYVSRLIALELARNRSFGRGKLGTAYVKLQQENFTIGDETTGSRLVLPGYRFSKEVIDNLVRPRRAYSYTLDLRGAHPYFGSDSALVQFIGDVSAVLPLPWRLSLHARSRLGYSLLPDPFADLPPSIRFFAGGDQSVRGYSYQSLGPRDAEGDVIGGKHLLFGSVELERALYKDWGVSIFHDAGNAFNDFKEMDLFHGTGIGLHYYTQVGGLNLFLAKPLSGDRSGFRIHFTVGVEL